MQKYCKTVVMIGWVAASLYGLGCSSSSDSTSSDDTGDTASEVTAAFPSDLILASPTETSSASSSLSAKAVDLAEGDTPNTFEEKKDAIDTLLEATDVTDCVPPNIDLSPRTEMVECYGPQLQLAQTHQDSGQVTNAQLPGGDLGIWEESEEDNEACVAAKMNAEIQRVQAFLDAAVFLSAASTCVAKTSGAELPAAGETLDLTQEVADVIEGSTEDVLPIELTTVTLEQAAEAVDVPGTDDTTTVSRPLYITTQEGEVSIPDDDGGTDTVAMQVEVNHIPLNDSNTVYRGVLRVLVASDIYVGSNCPQGTNTVLTTLRYAKTSDTELQTFFSQATYCGEVSDFSLVTNGLGEADFGKKYIAEGATCVGQTLASNANGWGDNATRIVANTDPTTGLGNMLFWWQAGRCDQNTRMLQMEITAGGASDGEADGGCGYFGFGDDAEEDPTEILGMVCNWAGPGSGQFGAKTVSDFVQRQCVAKNDDGVYESESALLNITYAPTNSCKNTSTLTCDGVLCPTDAQENLLPLATMEADAEAITEPAALEGIVEFIE